VSAPPTTRFAAAWITDTDGDVILDLSNGSTLPYSVTALDPGMPAVRASVQDAPSRYGTVDSTRYFGARAVTAAFSSDEVGRRSLMSTLSVLADPSQRFYLVVSIPEWGTGQWRMLLRPDQFSMPLTYSDDDIQAGWQAPDGVWETLKLSSRTIWPGGTATGGKVYPLSYPRDYGTGTAPGTGVITIGQNLSTPPVIRIYGPVTGPSITNASTGATLAFASSFTIAAGQYVAIDAGAGTVYANDDPNASRLQFIDWSQSNLWWFTAGTNQIQFNGTAVSAVTQTVLTWRERRI
jgi:hypothetical protein